MSLIIGSSTKTRTDASGISERRTRLSRLTTACVVLAVTCGSATPALSSESRSLSVSEFVNQSEINPYEAAAEVCTAAIPDSKDDWKTAVDRIRTTIRQIVDKQISSRSFGDLKGKFLPPDMDVVSAAKQEYRDKLKADNPPQKCQRYLTALHSVDRRLLDAAVQQQLAGIRTALVEAAAVTGQERH